MISARGSTGAPGIVGAFWFNELHQSGHLILM